MVEHFCYKGACGIHDHTCIKMFNGRAELGYINKWLRLTISTMLFKTVILLRI